MFDRILIYLCGKGKLKEQKFVPGVCAVYQLSIMQYAECVDCCVREIAVGELSVSERMHPKRKRAQSLFSHNFPLWKMKRLARYFISIRPQAKQYISMIETDVRVSIKAFHPGILHSISSLVNQNVKYI